MGDKQPKQILQSNDQPITQSNITINRRKKMSDK